MIALDLKQETPTTATPSLQALKTEKQEGALSFSALLKGIKEGDKAVQNGALVLALDENQDENASKSKTSKSDLLAALMAKKDEKTAKSATELEISPEVKATLSTVEDFKRLIQEAKTYLKDKIVNSDGFKRAEIAKLPKTLKGLMQVAKKIGIDLSKITLEEVRQQGDASLQSAETEDYLLEANKKKSLYAKKDTHQGSSSVQSMNTSSTAHKEHKKSLQIDNDLVDESLLEEQLKTQQKHAKKETPLFKAQKPTEISTQQIVNAKTLTHTNSGVSSSNKRSGDTLKLLLQGEKTAKQEGVRLTSDFSVATAKVIAPHAKSEAQKSLESLLGVESDKDEKNSSKMDGLQVAKADSFEVKLNEAKQMIKYLSQDVKQAIENYKAPFTRVKVQLNPQKLGEVDITIVQRGKNLHVNLSSNNAAMNTLAMNANDLKVQLQNNGIQNASLNFNNNSQGGDFASGGQAQQQQQRQNAQDEYAYFENEEQNEELLSSLEIVVPNYA
ncbi:MAG TPA: flagellar hook-length control protein FliK [Sulfurimonas autotrophica]|uniref:Flagellar hook-length control protein FliK n=1 Tax=Sulfurimonas autotrophica TaxID=202747 RepID=A0A7C3GIR1_9BACT|nr:flagellar hook-length control protein FliK [Sulfurimonas autotrophica]